MDYTDVLNSINTKLSAIISSLESIENGSANDLIVLLFCIFLVLWIMRGE